MSRQPESKTHQKSQRARELAREMRRLYRGGLGVSSISVRFSLPRHMVIRELEALHVDERPGREFRGDG